MRPLVIRYRKLGDSLMVTPVLRALAERGEVFAVGERAFERVFTGVSGVAGFVGLERGEPTRWQLVQAGLAARRFRPDTALILRFSRRATIIARLAGCERRFGGVRSSSKLLSGLTHNAYDPAVWPSSHQVEKYYAVAEAAYGPLTRHPTFYPTSTPSGLPRDYVVVHLGNGGSNLAWPDERFAEAICQMKREGMPVVATGCEDQVVYPKSRKVADIDLVGNTDLERLASVFGGARVVVALDGGGPRMAAAVGTPVVVLALGARWTGYQASPWMSPGTVIEATGGDISTEQVVGAAFRLMCLL